MHHNYGEISESDACRDCVWPIILDAELYTACPGERALVVITLNATFLQSDCLHSSLFFKHYSRILLRDWVLGHCGVCSFEGVSYHNVFVLYLASTGLGISVLVCSSVVPTEPSPEGFQ